MMNDDDDGVEVLHEDTILDIVFDVEIDLYND
jgi:hypothetical protein